MTQAGLTLRDYHDLLPLIYGTAIADETWPAALDGICAVTGAAGGFLRAFDRVMLPYDVHQASSIFIRHHQQLQYYAEHFTRYDEQALQHIAAQPAGQLILDTDIWGPIDVLRQREDFVWLRQTGGLFRRVGVRVNASPAWWDSVFLQFGQNVEEIPEVSLATFSLLLPHLAKALEMNRFFHILQHRFRAALAALNRVRVGVAVLLGNGRVLIANREAERLFDEGDALRLDRNQCLRGRGDDLSRELLAQVARLGFTSRGQDDLSEVVLAIERGGGRDPLLVELSPLQDARQELGADIAGVMLTLIDPSNRPAISTEHIGRLYNLTPAEAEVCEHLVNGRTQNDIADIRNVSQETVKTQVPNIYRKTQTARRIDLIRLAVEINPPIESGTG